LAAWDAPSFCSGNWRHLCVDMQRMFAEDTPWHVPWMDKVKDRVVEVSVRHAGRTIFTRFMPPRTADEAAGAWRDYYEQWRMITRERLPGELLGFLPDLRHLQETRTASVIVDEAGSRLPTGVHFSAGTGFDPDKRRHVR